MEMIEIATLPAVVEWEMKMNAHNYEWVSNSMNGTM